MTFGLFINTFVSATQSPYENIRNSSSVYSRSKQNLAFGLLELNV